MTLAMRAWVTTIAVASSACSLSWDFDTTSVVDADGGSAPLRDGAVLDKGQGGPAAASGDGGAVGDAASYECGRNSPCAPGLVCHYADHLCGMGTAGGRCVAPAGNCGDAPKVCGCDGTIYTDTCAANQAAEDVSARGNCTAPIASGDYACGYVFCWYPGLLPAQYCRHHTSGAETTYDCPFAPASCNSWNCTGCAMNGCGVCQTLLSGGWMFDCP
jgi:hypothetical protein